MVTFFVNEHECRLDKPAYYTDLDINSEVNEVRKIGETF